MTALPPKPTHNFFPLRFSIPHIPSDAERLAMIATEAYLMAERRGFAPGHDVEDWAAAESVVNTRLTHSQSFCTQTRL